MFPERPIDPPDDPLERARDEWESKFSMSETLNREDLDYLCERVEAGDFKTLQQWIKNKQHQHFISWMESVQDEEDYQRSEAESREREERWMLA